MTADMELGKHMGVTPDDAFSALGDETRLGILYTLSEADGPCTFSDLYDASDYDDPSNFNYHLKELEGQFVINPTVNMPFMRPVPGSWRPFWPGR